MAFLRPVSHMHIRVKQEALVSFRLRVGTWLKHVNEGGKSSL